MQDAETTPVAAPSARSGHGQSQAACTLRWLQRPAGAGDPHRPGQPGGGIDGRDGERLIAERAGARLGELVLCMGEADTAPGCVTGLRVDSAWRGRGVARALLSRALARARRRGLDALELDVAASDPAGQALCRALRFHPTGERAGLQRMRAVLPAAQDPLGVAPTPLERRPDLAAAFGLDIDLWVKRDDLYPFCGGGTKARKALHILPRILAGEHDVVVTTGGPQSNHARATALEAARLGLHCHLVLTGEAGARYPLTGNLLLMQASGATLEWCAKSALAATMDRAMKRYAAAGHRPFYLYGGGHCLAGTTAFVHAAEEALEQMDGGPPDWVVLASGTGGTQAGLAIGFRDAGARVLGISVARPVEPGLRAVRHCVAEYLQGRPGPSPELLFRDDWRDGGYEQGSPALLETLALAAGRGFILDATYSGKGWRGLVGLVRSGAISPGARVLFWHSGGLMNAMAGTGGGGVLQPLLNDGDKSSGVSRC